jgi:hypothetical protein
MACGPCRGWDEFSNGDLERFCDQILGKSVAVVADSEPESLKSLVGIPVGPKGILT